LPLSLHCGGGCQPPIETRRLGAAATVLQAAWYFLRTNSGLGRVSRLAVVVLPAQSQLGVAGQTCMP